MNIYKNIVIIIGVIFCAVMFVFAARGFSDQGKYVDVKGLSERIVKSDIAIWSMNFEVKTNDSAYLFSEIKKNITIITSFLKEQGFEDSEINVGTPNIYQDTYEGSLYRYNGTITLSVYTDKVDLVRTTSRNTLSLIEKGVVLSGGYVDFQFSDLASIKPEMLSEAIVQAKIAAEQFTNDSGVTLGTISRANQGVFDITEKDPGSPEYKKVRVVSSIRYLLK